MLRLNMEDHDLAAARLGLVRIGLIAYQKPFYQVLPLDAFPVSIQTRTASAHPQLIGHIFKQIIKEAP